MAVIRRMGFGLLKGLLFGSIVGGAIQFGLGWSTADGTLGTLLAIGTGATVGALCGKAPWRSQRWFMAPLKATLGIAPAALLYWVSTSYLAFALPFGDEVLWTAVPLCYTPLLGAVTGALIELDNRSTPDADPSMTDPSMGSNDGYEPLDV